MPDIAALADQFSNSEDPKKREELLYRLRAWAQQGVDLSSLKSLLENGFSGARSVAVLSASTLTFAHLHRDRWDEIDLIARHASGDVRWGAARAMSEFLAARPRSGPIVDRLGLALADDDGEVRKQAFSGLETVRKAGHAVHPSAAGLESIVRLLGAQTEVAEIVQSWVVRSRTLAATVRDLLRKREDQGRLLAICEDVVAGIQRPPCPICSNLDDFECAGHEKDLPKETQQLVPTDAEFRRCPTCGTRYRYAWDEMYEDEFGSTGTYNVNRLDPPPGSKSLRELREDIAHPSRRVRKESAGELTSICLAEGRWDELGALMADAALDVRLRTLMVMKGIDVDIAPLLPVLRERLIEANDDVQHAAATTLARQFIRHGDREGLRGLLAIDRRMVRWATICALDDAAQSGFDLEPFVPELRQLAKDPDDFVHDSAARALRQVRPKTG